MPRQRLSIVQSQGFESSATRRWSKTGLGTRVLLLMLVSLLAAACQGESVPPTMPTIAQIPSSTPTHTPTDTPTFTPTPTSTHTPTQTFTPTATFTPTLTATPTSTSTPTATFTRAATNTPTQPPVPVIHALTADPIQVQIGETTTLRWQTSADAVQLERYDSRGQRTGLQNVNPSGEMTVAVPYDEFGLITYQLIATRGGVSTTGQVSVRARCNIPWFFGTQAEMPYCPNQMPVISESKWLELERGMMVSLAANHRIYVLIYSTGRWWEFENLFSGHSHWPTVSEPVPEGVNNPQAELGWVWFEQEIEGTLARYVVGVPLVNQDPHPRSYQALPDGSGWILQGQFGSLILMSTDGTWQYLVSENRPDWAR